MLMAGERYLIHCIHISTLITPGAIFLCRHTYSPDLLPQFDLELVPVVNFDQFTLLPVVGCVWFMVRQRRWAALLLCSLGVRSTCWFKGLHAACADVDVRGCRMALASFPRLVFSQLPELVYVARTRAALDRARQVRKSPGEDTDAGDTGRD